MPAASPSELVNAILDAAQQSGGSSVYLSDRLQTHPRKFGVHYLDGNFTIWVYIWTLTHGGGFARPEDEYRIQLTTVRPPLASNPNGYTLLLGYYPDTQVFAGFDVERHRNFTPGSSSAQIKLSTLHEALQNGLGFYTKGNEEIVVAIRPDQFLNYVLNSRQLHDIESQDLPIIQRVTASDRIESSTMKRLPLQRQRIISEVSRFIRDANFRQRVLDAYGHRCAVTRLQLRLVDAAHILPVAVKDSTDETTNGIALSPTIHRAFDHALIYLDENRVMLLNTEKANELRTSNLANGLAELNRFLGRRIHLPADHNLWPAEHYIRKANIRRRIPGYKDTRTH